MIKSILHMNTGFHLYWSLLPIGSLLAFAISMEAEILDILTSKLPLLCSQDELFHLNLLAFFLWLLSRFSRDSPSLPSIVLLHYPGGSEVQVARVMMNTLYPFPGMG